MNTILSTEESLILRLRSLYEQAGYKVYKVRKFEEYSLYLENKNFLASEHIITFNDLSGKVLALKPDVTLSIAKNTKATRASNEKLYYKESVYRFDQHTHEYMEINQMGLEILGDVDMLQTIEVCVLALQSLAEINKAFALDLAHMGFLSGLFDSLGIGLPERKKIIACLKSKNKHDLLLVCDAAGIDDTAAKRLCEIIELGNDFKDGLDTLRRFAVTEDMEKTVEELTALYDGLCQMGYQRYIRLDFSIANDTDYYNGILFRGYIHGLHKAFLFGGRYDKLAKNFGHDIDAMGFSIYLSDLPLAEKLVEYDTDILLLYGDDSDLTLLTETVRELRESGASVRLEKNIPTGLRFGKILEV